MTLAYQFPQEKFQSLVDLVEKIDTSFASSWELRLYSRDPRLATKHVRINELNIENKLTKKYKLGSQSNVSTYITRS